MAQDHRHHEGVASSLLMPYTGVSSMAAKAKPAMNSRVNFTRHFTEAMSGVTRTVANNSPATVIAACEPSVPPKSTKRAGQKLSKKPFLSAAKKDVIKAMQPSSAVRLVRKIKN